MSTLSLLPGEQITFALRALYDRYGYSRYKMNKFEEYDLYARNKDFLISDGVITFTDTNGKLMALKPDVTLSIVKNTKDAPGVVQKLYYNESVYRVSKGTHSFREITQVGLEAIGEIDGYCIYEVLKLAAKSLACTGMNCILEISHLGILSEILQYAGIEGEARSRVIRCIGEKSLHELAQVCTQLGVSEEKAALLKQIASLCGTPDEVLPGMNALLSGIVAAETLDGFAKIISSLNEGKMKDMLRIDFSLVSDLQYYNGFVFKGFAEGLPSSILSGGQYDTLMEKMKRKSKAIGFAVYLDLLEQYRRTSAEFDTDTLLIYDESCSIADVEAMAASHAEGDQSVLVQKQVPVGLRYRRLIKMTEGRVEILENHA